MLLAKQERPEPASFTDQSPRVQAQGGLDHFLLPLARNGACASALPAADRSALVAAGSLSTLAASDAA
jgi:hypothetical protein